jgi:hypothetical protein
MVLTAPGMSLADAYRFNSAIMFYPQAKNLVLLPGGYF